ncbi:hypothetical protein DTO166G4_553 [Paecilomyces variotii]|nr:hypothetical protein DTO166G4_553 [Paecilomyces variotii]KAJ9237286.1 hypothetical protein DTO166G5_3682 [Paecilomyces variotii]
MRLRALLGRRWPAADHRLPWAVGRGRSPQTVQRLWSAVQYSPSLNNHRLLHLETETENLLSPDRAAETAFLFKMATATGSNMITLTSSDGVDITIEREVAERSILIKNMLEDLGDSGEAIPIPNVNESVLKKVIEWCTHHKNDPPSTGDEDDSRRKTTDIDEWDQKFMQVDQEMLFEIILAANYLDIKALLDVGCKTVANMIKGKSPEEIRKTFNIQNDFTPEEEDQIRRENEWAEDR